MSQRREGLTSAEQVARGRGQLVPANIGEAVPYIQLRNIEKMYPGLAKKRKQAFINLGKGDLDALVTYLTYKKTTPTQKYQIAEGAAGAGRGGLVNLLVDKAKAGEKGETSTVPISEELYRSMLQRAY